MSQQNVNDWTDKFGTRLEIGQRVAASRGKEIYVGKILYFTDSGVTLDCEDTKRGYVKTSIPYHQPGAVYLGPKRFYVIEDI
jgi:hypothetical protein